uniref:Sortilin N-terminal domain-containing protein n=2 Tax=Ciona intestinalis TaxID=7719 RepID=H2XSV3_CIOIN
MTKCSLIFVLFFIIFCCTTKAKIHSSQYLDREISPTLISQDDNADSNSLLMSRYKRFLLYRERRAAPSGQKKLKSYKFDLNDTTHNQALIHWSGKNSSVIFILTRKKKTVSGGGISDSSLWRSTNYGKTYEPEWKKFDNKTILNSYFVCPGNISKVIFIDTYNNCGRIWVSTTEGETYTPYMLSFSLDKIEFHPEEQDWLLGYDKQASVLYCSQDLGKTWSKLQSYVTTDRYFWYVKDVDTIENSTSIVHFEYRDMDVFPGRTFLVKSCFIPNCDP